MKNDIANNIEPVIEYHENGNIHTETWIFMSEIHRDFEEQPAKRCYNEDGILFQEEWYTHGALHNLKGPSVIMYDEEGVVLERLWYIAGVKRPFDSWLMFSDVPFEERVGFKLMYG